MKKSKLFVARPVINLVGEEVVTGKGMREREARVFCFVGSPMMNLVDKEVIIGEGKERRIYSSIYDYTYISGVYKVLYSIYVCLGGDNT